MRKRYVELRHAAYHAATAPPPAATVAAPLSNQRRLTLPGLSSAMGGSSCCRQSSTGPCRHNRAVASAQASALARRHCGVPQRGWIQGSLYLDPPDGSRDVTIT